MNRPDAPTRILEFTPAMQTLIEDAIEALILLLDESDGDAEMEPSLGSLWPGNHLNWAGGATDDCEIEDEGDPHNECEPEGEIWDAFRLPQAPAKVTTIPRRARMYSRQGVCPAR